LVENSVTGHFSVKILFENDLFICFENSYSKDIKYKENRL